MNEMRAAVRILTIACTIAGVPASPAASAATQQETRDHTIRETTRFSAVGCTEPAEHIVVLPKRSQSITPVSPLAGTQLYGSDPKTPVAVVSGVSYAPGIVTWRVTGTGASCTPGTLWETGVIDLKVQVTTVRRVLTRATVIRRGDAICRRGYSKATPLLRGLEASKLRRAARELRKMNRQLGALPIPSARSAFFKAMRTGIDDMQLATDAVASAAYRGDDAAKNAAWARALTAVGETWRAARRYGFRGACVA